MESDQWCWGELVNAVRGYQERLRLEGQHRALIAQRQAELTAIALAGHRLPELWESFPFWNEEEIKAQRVEKIRRIMERHAAAGTGRSV